MTDAQKQCPYTLPLVLHAPSARLFVVRVGILPSDPTRAPDDARQLLAQERAILHDVPDNRDPWVLLNKRSVRKSGMVTR